MNKTLIISIFIAFLTSCAPVRPWTKTEKTLFITSCLATVADMYSTSRALNDGKIELNPILGKHPSDKQLILFGIGNQSLCFFLGHYFPSLRIPLFGAMTVVHGVAAGWNYK